MVNSRQVLRSIVFALSLLMFSAASASLAFGQDFTISLPGGLITPAVNPGGSATGTIDLQPSSGFDNPVMLSCTPTGTGPVTTSPPVCTPSPDSATPPATPSLTITTTSATSAGTYPFALTGTSGSLTHTVFLSLSVEPLTADYTLSVFPTTATPSPVPAGSPATTTVTISPVGSYGSQGGHQITLSCVSVTPVVAGAPVCSFSTSAGTPFVQITSGVAATATLTITTFGTATTTGKLWSPRVFYALWLAIPGLALVGVGSTGRLRNKLVGMLLLMAVASGLLLMPSCSSTSSTNGPHSEVTPNNTYTFTLTGVDENGAAPSNSTTCTGGAVACNLATVTVTVN
jgi:hypothetical protein